MTWESKSGPEGPTSMQIGGYMWCQRHMHPILVLFVTFWKPTLPCVQKGNELGIMEGGEGQLLEAVLQACIPTSAIILEYELSHYTIDSCMGGFSYFLPNILFYNFCTISHPNILHLPNCNVHRMISMQNVLEQSLAHLPVV